MSANKDFDKKKFFDKDENMDSGVISGPLSEELDTPVERESDSKNVTESDAKHVTSDLDSGLDLSERLSSVNLSDYSSPTPLRPVPTITFQEPLQDIPPIELLFRQDDDGDTQLHIAAVHGCEKSVSTLIRVCPDRTWLDIQNDYGHTALHLAVLCGHQLVTRMLIIAGASVSVRDLAGQTPFHIATAEHQLQCLQALLAPVDNVPRKMASILNWKDYRGQTCVHIAAAAGHTDTLQTLVFFGADINAKEGLAGWTALHAAARRGDARVTAYLAGHCAGAALDARDYAGRTPRRLLPRDLRRHADFAVLPRDDDDDTDSEDEYDYDSDSESLFERLRESFNPINVA